MDWKYGESQLNCCSVMTLCLWWKRTSQQQQKYEGVGYVKPGGHVENVFKQMNYWKKKSWGKPVY